MAKKKIPVSFSLAVSGERLTKSMLIAEAEEMTKRLEPEAAFKMYVAGKAAEIMLKRLLEVLKPMANEQAIQETSDGKTIATMLGTQISVKASASTWDYGTDSVLEKLLAEQKLIEEKIQQHKKFRQTIPEGKEYPDPDTGEIFKRALQYGGSKGLVVHIPEV